MRSSWLLASLICFAVGLVLSFTIIFTVIGFALIILSIGLFIIGLIIPKQKNQVEVHIHHHKK